MMKKVFALLALLPFVSASPVMACGDGGSEYPWCWTPLQSCGTRCTLFTPDGDDQACMAQCYAVFDACVELADQMAGCTGGGGTGHGGSCNYRDPASGICLY